MNRETTICVMMSTYNGEKYIEQQIGSIVNQKDVNVNLLIRDDGSSDRTIEIINRLKESYGNITLIEGKNLGCKRSFLELLYSRVDADFYAFADQDDVWYESKMAKCYDEIKNEDGPALVCTNLMAVDSELNVHGILYSNESIERMKVESKYNYLSNMQGCVMFWNRALQDIIISYRPQKNVEHDIWVCSVANSVGINKILPEPLIKYRRHSNNVSEYALTNTNKIKKRIRFYLINERARADEIAIELISGYEQYMDKSLVGYKNLKKLSRYNRNVFTKISLLFSSLLKGRALKRRLFGQLCIILGKF